MALQNDDGPTKTLNTTKVGPSIIRYPGPGIYSGIRWGGIEIGMTFYIGYKKGQFPSIYPPFINYGLGHCYCHIRVEWIEFLWSRVWRSPGCRLKLGLSSPAYINQYLRVTEKLWCFDLYTKIKNNSYKYSFRQKYKL